MAAMEKGSALADAVAAPLAEARLPRSVAIAARGVKTSTDFAELMSAVMSDLIEGRLEPGVGNATCNAGGKLLRVVELQYRYGSNDPSGDKVLRLAK